MHGETLSEIAMGEGFPQPTDIRAALKEAMARLRAAAVPSHTLAAELLLIHTLGRDRTWFLYTHPRSSAGICRKRSKNVFLRSSAQRSMPANLRSTSRAGRNSGDSILK